MTTQAVRPANAGAITRSLVAAHFTRGEERKAARGVVRGGWSTFTEGVVSEQDVTTTYPKVQRGFHANGSPRMVATVKNTPTGFVKVRYQFSRASDNLTSEERVAKALSVLTRAAEHLTAKGYIVEARNTELLDAMPYLFVSRRDSDNNVVVF